MDTLCRACSCEAAQQATRCTESESKDEYAVKIRVWVGASRIAGKGLFATQDIKKGTRIIQYIGRKITKAETADRLYQGNQYIFEFNDRYNIDGKALKNKARSINHSCDPNCDILITKRTIWIVAKRDIQEGEELSYNYRFTAKQYRCTCGAKHCCGYILAEVYERS
jgi:SET domain-containing protein